MDTDDAATPVAAPSTSLYGLVSLVTVGALALTEQFAGLPPAVVALASGWFIVRRDAG
jgi:hypothetical protein